MYGKSPNASMTSTSNSALADCAIREMRIVNKKGLHARATAKLVQCIERFEAEVFISRCDETVSGSSIMGILTLGAGIGSTIKVAARGPQARQALAAIGELVAGRFGEDE